MIQDVARSRANSGFPVSGPGQGMLVALDPGLPAVNQLAAGVLPGATLLWLTAGDRLAQIADFLATHRGYQSLHLVTHGAPGQIHWGEQVLSPETLPEQAATLQRWRAHLPPGFPLVLYGCAIAAGDRGRHFLQALHQETGATIYASATPTGSPAQGGDWEFSSAVAPHAAPLAFSPACQVEYPALLVATVAELIAAINTANSTPGPAVINLTATTFNLTAAADNDPVFGATGLPEISSEITINGFGTGSTIQRDGSAPAFRLFRVGGLGAPTNGNLTLSNITLTGGFAGGAGGAADDGGALINVGGTVTLNNSVVTGNRANDDGGGILSLGTALGTASLTVNNPTISTNIAVGGNLGDGGGGIDADGNRDEGGQGSIVTINDSTITGNSSTNGIGGGIRVRDGAELILNNSTVSGNTAAFGSGMAEVTNGPATANTITLQNNPTITGNQGSGLDFESPHFVTPNNQPPNNNSTPTINGTANLGFTNILAVQPPGAAVRVVRLDASGNSLARVEDGATLNLGAVQLNAPFTTQFRVENWGQADLAVAPVSSEPQFVTVAPAGPVTLTNAAPTQVFTLTLNTSTEGAFASTIQFDSGDPANPFNFEVQATITSTPIVAPPTITNNIFVVGQTGNLKLQVQSAPTNQIVEVRAARLDANDQVVGLNNLFSVLPDGFRPSGFSAALQQTTFGPVTAGDRLGFELVTLDGRTITYTSDQLRITDLGGDRFSFGFEINGDGLFDDVVLTIQQTTEAAPLGVGTNQRQGFEVLDLLGLDGVNVNFTVYREAVFNNVVGFYRIDDASGAVGGLAPGQPGYAQAAIGQRVGGLELFAPNQGLNRFSATLAGNALYAPFLIVNGDPLAFLNNNPDNIPGFLEQAYFIFTAANPDGADHVRLLGDNVFGFEDLPGGGDFDYNDIIVSMNLG